MKIRPILVIIITVIAISNAGAATLKSTQFLMLGDTEVKINIYQNEGARITFFVPHHDEQIGFNAAKEIIEKKGGRLIEIESVNESGTPQRNLYFKIGAQDYNVDPNRIYTEKGRQCAVPAEASEIVKAFADSLLQVILAPDGKSLREGEIFVVAVHNNGDNSSRSNSEKRIDLTAFSFLRSADANIMPSGTYAIQADGVYFSNLEADVDNFVYLSTTKYVGHFAAAGFNVIVQRSASRLRVDNCNVDDGSLSVFAGLNSIEYINLEADGIFGRYRQNLMFEAVYKLLPEPKQ